MSSSKLLQISLLLALLFVASRHGLLVDAKDQPATATEQFRVNLASSSRKQYRKASWKWQQSQVGSKRVRKAPSGPNPVGNHSPPTKQ